MELMGDDSISKFKKLIVKGSITVEAAIILPFFIMAVMSFAFIVKLYYTHEIIQQAISGACNEISVYSLLYYETNADDLISGIERFSYSEKVSDALGDIKLTAFIQQLGKDAAGYVRTQLALVPITKVLVKNKLEAGSGDNVDERLKFLNLKDGFAAIDFTESRMLADNKSIDIIAKYEMSFPFLPGILPGIKISQKASARIWAGEEGIDRWGTQEENQEKSVWDMDNLKRGKEIRKLQGATLPFNFPVVAKFENGTVTSIKSLNLDEAYYSNTRNLELKISGYINKLEDFSGGTAGGAAISSHQIFRKELVLIIPETVILPGQQSTLDKCIQNAKSKGINLKIVKAYGKQGSVKDNAGEAENGGIN